MGVENEEMPMDDKAKRMRDLLSSFYTPDHSVSTSNPSPKFVSLDAINTSSFDAEQYMNLLVQKSSLEGLLHRHVEMAAEIKNLDTDLQMLVYENYNKFISATDTIKRMKTNIVGMEANMEQLLEKIMSVQSKSDGVNTSLFEKREHIEKLHRTRNLLRKVQFIYDLPSRLAKCIKSEAYADAVRFYTGSLPIFKIYGDSSFHDCKRASEEAMATITKNLQGKLFSDSESIQARAEAAMLLKQLDFPVDSLKAKLFEKLEQSLEELYLRSEEITNVLKKADDLSLQKIETDSVPVTADDASVWEFVEAVRAYRVIFPDSEDQLIRLSKHLLTKNFEVTYQYVHQHVSVASFLGLLRIIWKDVLLLDEVLNEASLPGYSLEASQVAVKEFIQSRFAHLLHDISDAITSVHVQQKEGVEELSLQVTLESGKNAVMQGSIKILVDARQLLDDNLDLLVKLRDMVISSVRGGFQEFFKALNDHFLFLSGKNKSGSQILPEGTPVDKVFAGLVLVLSQLSAYIEQDIIPRITEDIGAYFTVGVTGYESESSFDPAEVRRIFQSASEKLLQHYINMRTQRVSVLLRKRFTTPNWVKHKEPREVHMFVDLFLQELDAVRREAKQVLPQGAHRKHRRSESNGSSISSRSNPLRDDKMSRSNTQRARSQLLETHLAKLFKQKVEIFTKIEHTQESVVTTIVKLCLKSLQEFVRLQTFNRSGFQQIQLDIQFLRGPLTENVEDEAAVDFLLDEVIVSASERCLDVIPLEPPILDKLIQAKLAKSKERSPVSS